MKKLSVFILIAVFSLSVAAPVFAAAKSSAPKFEYLFYYVPGFTTFYSFQDNAAKVGIFAPQNFAFDGNGNLTGSLSDMVKGVITANSTKVMPLIANADFDSSTVDAFLHSQTAETNLINQLVVSAKANNYIGWQFDIEAIPVTDRDLYSKFVENAAKIFHAANLKLSVAVVARVSDNPSDLPAGSWDNWAGVYDYARIGKAADFVSVMAYDQAPSTGPVSSLTWFKKVVAFSLKSIPKSKLSIGIPTYGWEWNLATAKRVGSVSNAKIADLIATKQYIAKGYDSAIGEAWLTTDVTTNGTTTHYKIWYENAKSFAMKLAIAKADKLRGVSVWVLGMEDAGIWKLF